VSTEVEPVEGNDDHSYTTADEDANNEQGSPDLMTLDD
jgi:hypothetical protein